MLFKTRSNKQKMANINSVRLEKKLQYFFIFFFALNLCMYVIFLFLFYFFSLDHSIRNIYIYIYIKEREREWIKKESLYAEHEYLNIFYAYLLLHAQF